VRDLLSRHQTTVTDLAHGLALEVISEEEKIMLQPFLDRFFVMVRA
jgi:hypothetical protein